MGQLVHLVAVGKLKDQNYINLENEWLKRLGNPKLEIHEVRANADNPEAEGNEVLKKIQNLSKSFAIFLLAENGKEFDSHEFANWLVGQWQQPADLFLVLGGARGHGQKLSDLATGRISLSKLTFPHKMARLVLVEQYYRAQTIINNHPYHH